MSALLEIRHLMKYFPGIKALDDVQLDIRAGEVHALIGENGAGKSTLVKIVTGVYTPTGGTITLEGRELTFSNALDAQRAGIVAIHQEASMFPELSVAENIFMGHHKVTPRFKRLDWKGMNQAARSLLERLQLDIAPETLVKNLGVAQRHMVEIAKALSLDAKVVIMDEPTSALTSREVEDLYRIVRQLKAEGKAIVFISHKFEEIFEICDAYTVLRDGRYIGSGYLKDTDRDSIIRMMIGRSVTQMFPKRHPQIGKPLLEVHDLCLTGSFSHVDFTLHEGEILGFFGLVGAGRSEVVRAVFGIDACSGGRMLLDGEAYAPRSPSDAMERGIALVPEDRQKQGLVLAMSIARNISLPRLGALSRYGIVDRKGAHAYAQKYGTEMEIRAAGWHVDADTLSGGNQQKVVLSKWIGTEPRILIMDEPTKGIDVATKAAVHEFVSDMAGRGMGVILISSELPEVLGMSDRVVVMHEGVVTAVLDRSEASAENVMAAAIGEKQESAT